MSANQGLGDKPIGELALVKLCTRFPGTSTALGSAALLAAFFIANNPPTEENIATYKARAEAAKAYDAALPKPREAVDVVQARMDKLVQTYGAHARPKVKAIYDNTSTYVVADCSSYLQRDAKSGAANNPAPYFTCLTNNNPSKMLGADPANVKGALGAALLLGLIGGVSFGSYCAAERRRTKMDKAAPA